jgi:hypothetical protein
LGLFGNVGLTRLFPLPPATLRSVIETLNEPVLDAAWSDDTTFSRRLAFKKWKALEEAKKGKGP